MILQNIDAWSLEGKTGFQREHLFPYFWNYNVRKEFFESEPFTIWEKYVPMYRYRSLFPITKEPPKLTNGDRQHWNGLQFKKMKEVKFSPNDTTIRMFDNYLAEALSEGIRVVLVYTPQYIGATMKTSNQTYMHELYQRIADKYDIPILDYTYMQICKDTTYFYNAMHLNRRGAELFSDSLACDLKRLMETWK